MHFSKNLVRTFISNSKKVSSSSAAAATIAGGSSSKLVATTSSVMKQKVSFGGSSISLSNIALSSSSSIKNYHTTTRSNNKKVIPFMLADIGEGITKVEVVKWFIKEGDHIEQFQNVAEVMSDKANVEISSRFDGIVKKLCYNVGDIANVGAPLIEIEVVSTGSNSTPGAGATTTSTSSDASTSSTATATSACSLSSSSSDLAEQSFGKILTTPAVRRIARENNIDLTLVQASGRNGRVLKEDVLSYLENPTATKPAASSEKVSAATSAPTVQTTTVQAPISGDRREPVRGLMRTMIKTMNAATKVPHFGYKDEVTVDNLMTLRNHLKKTAERQGVKLSYMPFIIKAVSLALKEYPILNSSLSEDESEIIYKGDHNIGVAMDTPNGLLVPNIKSVQNKSIIEIAAELNRLQELGKQGKLGSNDLRGGTFTLSNIGTIGGTYADPVLSIPEVCIGAIGMIKKVATFDAHNNIVPKHIMYMSWAADHRVVDGASMARFSNVWKEYLENPDNFIVALK